MSLGLKKNIRLLRRFFRSLEGRGVLLCLMDAMLNRECVRKIKIKISGTEFYVRSNISDLRVTISCLFEQEHRDVHCADPKVIIDAGANIGASAVYFALRFPNARIIAIEPEEGNYAMLCRNAAAYANITTVHAALWSDPTRRMIQDRHKGSLGYTITDTDNKTKATGQEVECLTITELIDTYHIDRIDLLKMDIEGSEKEVLEHSAGWIDKVDAITAELHDKICPGCERAYYIATRDFARTEKYGEKIIAYRHASTDP